MQEKLTGTLRNGYSQMVKNPPANAGDIRDLGSIPGSGRSPGGEHGNPLQYSCLENPMDRGALQATVHGVCGHNWTVVSTQQSDTTELLGTNAFKNRQKVSH